MVTQKIIINIGMFISILPMHMKKNQVNISHIDNSVSS